MLNRYPLWKNLLIMFVLVFGVIYAAPNLYPEDYALQVSGTRGIYQTDAALMARIEKKLKREKIDFKSTELTTKNGLIRFTDGDLQLKAKQVVTELLGDNYVVALNLAPTTPQWLEDIGAGP
ncbi:MAG: protein translocase subunit SecD, partial [Pseudomonadales bacterium]|nr:protein translocase subunit SecD [Pseudomonadales bacterium]